MNHRTPLDRFAQLVHLVRLVQRAHRNRLARMNRPPTTAGLARRPSAPLTTKPVARLAKLAKTALLLGKLGHGSVIQSTEPAASADQAQASFTDSLRYGAENRLPFDDAPGQRSAASGHGERLPTTAQTRQPSAQPSAGATGLCRRPADSLISNFQRIPFAVLIAFPLFCPFLPHSARRLRKWQPPFRCYRAKRRWHQASLGQWTSKPELPAFTFFMENRGLPGPLL